MKPVKHAPAALALLASFALAGASAAAFTLAPDLAAPVLAEDAPVPTTAVIASAKAARAGKQAPEAVFSDAEGKPVALADLLEKGPVVLIFYRGGWCPYCVKQLKAFEDQRESIEAAGGRIVAVSTELPEFTAKTREKNKLGFEVLSDPGAKASRAFGVAWANARYGPGLAKYQGNDKGEIPLGVTYVIDPEGTIRWAYLEDDYKKRATPQQAIDALNEIE
jgi:peroxiredoxin